ncbi:LysR family transcriptional regulator [Beijerinckiaceae bacterium RH AL1]|nr:LysR family transcriptional regulator [Beijerinckiaceae bacterium]VVB44589.1 LysR family transcriptional regulator [Beijerinckiaceae bacterium RH CH11]VVB44667.1 LysR family transcriptional regulator [Beijerinckiaceae bacterium RH AL8]VVC54434.1 LysR family transcriptional regulator [Beijerinckiaceae bacterium RH AL1]
MADDVGDLRFFVRLAGAGSLSAVARALNSSPAAMSRRLAALETRLGVRLVHRTTRSFDLTPEGSLFHERCLRIVEEIDEAEAEAAAGGVVPRGLLRIGVPLEIGRRRIAPLVADFVALYPKVEVHLMLSDAILDVVGDALDVVLYIGTPTEQGLITSKILSSDLLICAAPDYLARRGTPREPRDILDHDCIRLVRGRRIVDLWTFLIDGKPQDLRVSGSLTSTSAEVVHDWALAGKGVALKAYWDVAEDLASGRLVRLLTPYRRGEITLSAVYLARQHLAPRVRLFLDFIRTHLR